MYDTAKHNDLFYYINCLYFYKYIDFNALKHTNMAFGERLILVRKEKNLSQSDIGKLIGINGDAYGRYERNDVKPTIEIATRIANALNVSLDYLVGKTDLQLDSKVIEKIEEISKMEEKDKQHAFFLLDALIAKVKLRGFI
jgi:transcriptional regulator with XRE-family HTH domain